MFSLLWRMKRIILLVSLALLVVYTAQLPQVTDGFARGRDALVRGLAWGLLPPVLWALALALAWQRRRWLLRWRLWHRWLAALMIAPLAWGILAYFSDFTGILGEVTLGGEVGQQVKGTSDILGAFRLAGLALLTTVVALPTDSWRLTRRSLPRIERGSILAFRFLRRLRVPGVHSGRPGGLLKRNSQSGQRERGQESGITVGMAPRPDVPLRPTGIAPPSARPAPEGIRSREAPRERLFEGPTAPTSPTRAQPVPEPVDTRTPVAEWSLPTPSLLAEAPVADTEPDIDQEETARLIEKTLEEYGIEVRVDEVKPGPTVTMFGLVPGWVRRSRETRERDSEGKQVRDAAGRPVVRKVEDRTRVRVDSIVAREKDLALALAAPSLRIEAPIPGASLVGIEVPNAKPTVVTLRSVMESDEFHALSSKSKLALALGRGSGGEVSAADLARMPHLLIAGATGSGKSVCINSVIACIIMYSSPWETRMVLIDPKRVELTPFNGVPHLIAPVIVEVEDAVTCLKGMIQEMMRRYRQMEAGGARNIESYNRGVPPEERMPRLVLAIDELADLMMAKPHDIEHSIIRLAQLGRATGIHLVVATQRPSVDVVTGLIKANFPSRISFAVASQVDSRTILDSVGAEKLLGRGDMLFQPQDAPKPRRIQGALVSDSEIADLVEHWRRQRGPMPPEIPLWEEGVDEVTGISHGDLGDELLEKAWELATHHNRLSTSLLQRRLRIGYPRAARLMDLLEEEGVVGPGEPGKSREVIVGGGRKQFRED